MINIANAEFVMYSLKDWPVEQFAQEMDIKWSSYYKIGDRIENVKRCKVETACKVSKKIEFDVQCPTVLLKEIIAELEPQLALIKQYIEQYDISCVLYLHAIFHNIMVPNIQVDSAVIRFANDVDAKLDIYLNTVPSIAS